MARVRLVLVPLAVLSLVSIYRQSDEMHMLAASPVMMMNYESLFGSIQSLHSNNKNDPDEFFDPSSWEHLNASSSSSAITETEHCVLRSNHTRRDALVRIVVFQKDGGMQLENLLIHYLQAVRYDEIVIVDQQGVDPMTTAIAQQYVNKGVHLWRCNGSMKEKGEQWSEVIAVYKNDSQYIFPVDVDELLAIRTNYEPGESFGPALSNLDWNRKALEKELSNLPASEGKPNKTLDAKPIPLDCHVHGVPVLLEEEEKQVGHLQSQQQLTQHAGPLCKIKGMYRNSRKAKSGCFEKIFFRAKDFQFTDIGNHHGHVKYTDCKKMGVEATYVLTNFVLVHFQVTSFSDWLLHALRLAADKGFNRLERYKCPPGHTQPYHSCPMFQDFTAMNFSIYEMREMYRSRKCRFGQDWAFMSASNLTARSCRAF